MGNKNLFEGRKKNSGHVFEDDDDYGVRNTSTKKNGLYYTSKMQGILTEMEAAEQKAADLLSEFLVNQSETTLDETKLMISLKSMIDGFSMESQNRILTRALIKALVRIA